MDAIERMLSGYRAFRDGMPDDHAQKLRQLVEAGQKPQAAVIACSDSRVDPALVFRAEPGDIFMIRNGPSTAPVPPLNLPFWDSTCPTSSSSAMPIAAASMR